MEIKTKIVFIATVFVILVSSCKKYKEDSFTSFRTPRYRLKGLWKIKKMPDNSTLPSNTEDHYFEFNNANNLQFKRYYIEDFMLKSEVYQGEWKFNDHQNQLILSWDCPTIPSGNWDIKKLVYDEIKLCTKINEQNACLLLSRRKSL